MVIRGRRHFFLFILLAFFLRPSLSSAYLVQILHTNDIHSYFDGIDHDKSKGGYANIKYLVEKLKKEASKKGIESLVMDAGDFMEGTVFYMSDLGKKSFMMHNEIGYDFSVIGNHDYLMGTRGLNHLLGLVDLNFTYLGANIFVPKKYKHIHKKIIPYKIIHLGGHKVAIMGLTTNELIYSWRLTGGYISNPKRFGKKLAKKLKKKMGVGTVIALTHIGLKEDKKLAKKAPDIDLIIGGHSHHALFKPFYQESKDDKKIGIVQAGKHGEYLGRLLIDITESGLEIVEYELIPVQKSENADPQVLDLVDESYRDLYSLYGEDYLNEEVSTSYLTPNSRESKKIWSAFTADAMKESLDTDISVQQENMSGPQYPVGPITHFDLFNAHPRWFELKDVMGWKVYKAKVSGFFLKFVFKVVMNFGLPLSFSGVTFDWAKKRSGKYKVKKLRINGERILPFKSYSIALPEGIVRGGLAITKLVGFLLRKSAKSEISIIDAIKLKLKREGGVGDDYFKKKYFSKKLQKFTPIERTFFPGSPR